MNSKQFSELIFTKRRTREDFQNVITFTAQSKSNVELEQHMVYAGLCIHALDFNGSYSACIADVCEMFSFDLQGAIALLRTFLDTQQFAPEYTHVNQLVLSKDLTSIVQSFFQAHHPEIFRRIKDFCHMKVKNHKHKASYFQKYRQAARSSPEKCVERNAKEVVSTQARTRDAARRQRIALADDAVVRVGVRNPDQPLLWETFDIQNPNQFVNAQLNPNLSLVLFLFNSGHSYLPPLENNVLHRQIEKRIRSRLE